MIYLFLYVFVAALAWPSLYRIVFKDFNSGSYCVTDLDRAFICFVATILSLAWPVLAIPFIIFKLISSPPGHSILSRLEK